jgi:hypothetical protein
MPLLVFKISTHSVQSIQSFRRQERVEEKILTKDQKSTTHRHPLLMVDNTGSPPTKRIGRIQFSCRKRMDLQANSTDSQGCAARLAMTGSIAPISKQPHQTFAIADGPNCSSQEWNWQAASVRLR